MSKYQITLNGIASESLERQARELGVTPEELAVEILNLHLLPTHNMEQEEIARGYEEMGEINLALAD